MRVDSLTDYEVEAEIAELQRSDAVKLAEREARYKAGRRRRLYQLRWLKKHGEELMAQGYSLESSFLSGSEEEYDTPC